jgi:L-ascorbate metabolism protein UlaG (beta-lactamase superfamily)
LSATAERLYGCRVVTLEWFGTATFRITVAGVVLFFDGYLDRVPGLPPVGLTTEQVDAADFVFVSHAHFDHLAGVDVIARRTGATVVGNPESMHVLRAVGIPEQQLLTATGGETIDCGEGISVRVLPALHSCIFAESSDDAGAACFGDVGLSEQQRATKRAELVEFFTGQPDPVGEALREMLTRSSWRDGGQLAFHLITPTTSVLISGSAGYWSGVFTGLRPDVAVLAAGGRPNLDGEPVQASIAQFIVDEVRALQPQAVTFCHHDALLPGFDDIDTTPIRVALAEHLPGRDRFRHVVRAADSTFPAEHAWPRPGPAL